jgi:hypothetical protein
MTFSFHKLMLIYKANLISSFKVLFLTCVRKVCTSLRGWNSHDERAASEQFRLITPNKRSRPLDTVSR